jgi:ADP-dependent NAD(P)H-hydrate dehydratase / NAD(P)H-hydrate epimerase
MTDLLTAAQTRAAERAAIEAGRTTGTELMERAGAGVVEQVFALWPDFAGAPGRALVLCGPGNNGGDGFVVARLLSARGWTVELFLYGDTGKLPEDAAAACARWQEIGRVGLLTPFNVSRRGRPDLIVDAVFGAGLSRPLPAPVGAVLRPGALPWEGSDKIRRVAVDAPSGLDLDTGGVPAPEGGDAAAPVSADLTVTFHRPKPGHYLGQGPDLCGRLAVVDIGLDDSNANEPAESPDARRLRLVDRGTRSGGWPMNLIGKQRGGGHKFDHGHALVFCGGVGRGGAGRLAARAALRAGAGLVTLVCPPAALQENACRLDAVMLRALGAEAPFDKVADDRVSGFCLGPGMGTAARTRALVEAALARPVPEGGRLPVVVLDADALSVFADAPEALFAQTHARTVLTPHPGEFARLFPDLAKTLSQGGSKVDATRAAAERAGCIVLLKGADTVIAAPGGRASLHAAAYDRAAPWLATAGAGDVLAGMITGLACSAGSAELFEMVEAAVFLHVEAALEVGPGLIAEDLSEALPRVFAGLLRSA